MILFGDRGVPDVSIAPPVPIEALTPSYCQGYRFEHGYVRPCSLSDNRELTHAPQSGHTFKWVNKNGGFHYVQIHLRSDQGVKFLTQDKAVEIAGQNPDYATQGPSFR